MVIGGCGGGALGLLLHELSPALVPHPAELCHCGNGRLLCRRGRRPPFSTIVIVSEMTGGYDLLLPSLWVCALAFMLSDEHSIYSSTVDSRSHSPAHQEVNPCVTCWPAGQRSVSSWVRNATSSACFPTTRWRPFSVDLAIANGPVLPVVDPENRLLGVVNLEELHLAAQLPIRNHLSSPKILCGAMSALCDRKTGWTGP